MQKRRMRESGGSSARQEYCDRDAFLVPPSSAQNGLAGSPSGRSHGPQHTESQTEPDPRWGVAKGKMPVDSGHPSKKQVVRAYVTEASASG